MTAHRGSPARPRRFGPFVGNDIVAHQAEALVQRYDLLDELAAGGKVRRDLDPKARVNAKLQQELERQLVPWVDYEPEDASDHGWPIPPGVRVEALCYSAWLDPPRGKKGAFGGKQVFALPQSASEFARQFYVRSGIRAGRNATIDLTGLDAEFLHGFKFTPLIVGEVAMSLRAAGPPAEHAFRLLVSREYEAACELDGRLLESHSILENCGFEHAAVIAFERLDEIARIGMVVRKVEYLAPAGIKLRALLDDANDDEFVTANSVAPGVAFCPKLAAALASDPAMLELCEYLSAGTDVLASWRNAVVADRGTFHDGFRPAAFLALGSIESDTASALSWMVDVRTTFLAAFDPPRTGKQQQSALKNDYVAKFYGLSNFSANLAAALMANFKRPGGAPPGPRPQGTTAKNHPHDVRESIAPIVTHLGRDGIPVYAGVQTVQSGAPLAKISLPARGEDGSAPRADDRLWRNRYRDQPFWTRFQTPGATWYALLSMPQRDRDKLEQAILDLSALAAAKFPWAPSSLTARVVSDLATGVSAISVNPAHVRSMRKLRKFNGLVIRAEERWKTISAQRQRQIASVEKLKGFTHGHRWIEEIKAIADPPRHRKDKNSKGKK